MYDKYVLNYDKKNLLWKGKIGIDLVFYIIDFMINCLVEEKTFRGRKKLYLCNWYIVGLICLQMFYGIELLYLLMAHLHIMNDICLMFCF